MDWHRRVRELLPRITGELDRDAEIRDELAQHCAEREAELLRQRVPPDRAVRTVLGELSDAAARGDRLRHAAQVRAGRSWQPREWHQVFRRWATNGWQDARHAVRGLARTPAGTTAAVLTFALSIGAATVIFSVVNGVLLRPLPYPGADRLVRVWETSPQGEERVAVARANFLDWRDQAASFAALGAYSHPFDMALTGGGDPLRVHVTQLTPSVLAALAMPPAAGRLFDERDGRPGEPRVALLTAGFWEARFGGEASAIGTAIVLDDRSYEIVGVLPPPFAFPTPHVDLVLPIGFTEEDRQERTAHNYNVVGRLAPGVSPEQAAAEMQAIVARLTREHPAALTGWGINLVGLHADEVRGVRPLLVVLMAMVVVVLLMASANLANLQLARASRRGGEMAVRAAIGAGRGRIARQLLTESLVLAALGGTLGAVLAVLSLQTFVAAAPGDIPFLHAVRLDPAVAAFAAGVTLLSAVLVGLAPALHAGRIDLQAQLQQVRVRSSSGPGRLRHALVAIQVGLALVLIISASLLVRSFWNLHQVDPGFDADALLTVELQLPGARYPDNAAQERFYEELLDRIRRLPGVDAAATTTAYPGTGAAMTFSFAIEGRQAGNPTGREDPFPLQAVTSGYFETMGIRLLRGRTLEARDRVDQPLVVVINDALARRFWPDGNAVGQRIVFRQGQTPWWEIVGVVADTRDEGLDRDAPPTVYIPFAQKQANWSWMAWQTLLVRASGDPLALVPAVQSAIWRLDDQLPLLETSTMSAAFAENAARRRFAMQLVSGFAVLALLLGVIGISGVLSFAVSERRQEIGIRMALGAGPRQVAGAVVQRAIVFAAFGLALGLAASLALTQLLRTLLFDITPVDPVVFGGSAAGLFVVSTLASWVPVRRALRLDPTEVLRQ
jgi:predicted permease